MKKTHCLVATLLVVVPIAYSASAAAPHQHGARTSVPTTVQPPPSSRLAPKPEQQAYRQFNANEPMLDWRLANERVAQIGGWRAYAKEAAASSAKANESVPRNANKSDGVRP